MPSELCHELPVVVKRIEIPQRRDRLDDDAGSFLGFHLKRLREEDNSVKSLEAEKSERSSSIPGYGLCVLTPH